MSEVDKPFGYEPDEEQLKHDTQAMAGEEGKVKEPSCKYDPNDGSVYTCHSLTCPRHGESNRANVDEEHLVAFDALTAMYGEAWTTDMLRQDFDVLGFSMGLVVVQRKSDNKKGSLDFEHSPRVYHSWQEHTD